VAQENVSVTRTVAAPAERVFAVLADPTTHPAIDGTGWVRKATDQEPLTRVGQVFRMDMYHANHPDGEYKMANEVQVLDPPRTISWRPGQEEDGRLEFGGWWWRYDLAPADGSGTEVTLTFDWSAVPPQIREYIQFPPFEIGHLHNSLDHLADLAART
jgi:uncharacterized protein YndB with AHSA1/START domain